jgi:hypothetical protein
MLQEVRRFYDEIYTKNPLKKIYNPTIQKCIFDYLDQWQFFKTSKDLELFLKHYYSLHTIRGLFKANYVTNIILQESIDLEKRLSEINSNLVYKKSKKEWKTIFSIAHTKEDAKWDIKELVWHVHENILFDQYSSITRKTYFDRAKFYTSINLEATYLSVDKSIWKILLKGIMALSSDFKIDVIGDSGWGFLVCLRFLTEKPEERDRWFFVNFTLDLTTNDGLFYNFILNTSFIELGLVDTSMQQFVLNKITESLKKVEEQKNNFITSQKMPVK